MSPVHKDSDRPNFFLSQTDQPNFYYLAKMTEPFSAVHALWLYKDHGKSFSTSGPYIFPKFQYQWSLCGPYFLQIF